jgi:isopenicillin-N epimerase
VTSHYIDLGFPTAFDYTGTRDYTAWLATPAAVEFLEAQGPQALWAHEASLVDVGSVALLQAGALPVAERSLCAAMRAFFLPQARDAVAGEAEQVIATLWEKERIRIRCTTQAGRLILRFSGQAYVSADDLLQLGDALQRHGWPARS